MRRITLFTVSLMLAVTGCSKVPQEKAITILNAAAVDAPLLKQLRTFAETELHVSVRTLENPELAGKKDFQTLEKAAERVKTDEDVILIVLAGFNHGTEHLNVFPESGIALVDTQALYTGDQKKFARRLERMVMRAAAFTFGLEPTPDPFCVTRDYRSLEDLDTMGRNFSPPWQGRFADEAVRHGLAPKDVFAVKSGQGQPVP